jgi:hypothetical protein
MAGKIPSLFELFQLTEQLELDKDLPVALARERDHAIASRCSSKDDAGRLLFWLQEVSAQRPGEHAPQESWLNESSAAILGRILALFFGFSSMAAFLLTSGRGLVNVFVFLLLFVVVQVVLCLIAAMVMVRTVSGQQPVVLPVNPARLVVARVLPDRRYLRESQSVLRLLFLRYGQELGAIFTLGAIAAFFVVLAMSDFTFVWGSTFELSDGFVERMSALLAAPWSAFVPAATVTGELIAASRFHPAISYISPGTVEAMRGWWPFLIMAMVCYALLPRLLLWLASIFFYGRQMRAAFTRLPGSARVLARMQAPLVMTQGEGREQRGDEPLLESVALDPGLLLLNWANALAQDEVARFGEFAALAEGNIVNGGLGSLPEELARLGNRFDNSVQQIYVAVKSWEPPMADLADFLANFSNIHGCTLFLVPLAHRPVTADKLGDWEVFARSLDFAMVDVQALSLDHVAR